MTIAAPSPVQASTATAAVTPTKEHPALSFFVSAQQLLAAGDLEEAAKQTLLADESLRSVPIEDPKTHQALTQAHALVMAMAQEQAQSLRGQLQKNGAARKAVAQYGR